MPSSSSPSLRITVSRLHNLQLALLYILRIISLSTYQSACVELERLPSKRIWSLRTLSDFHLSCSRSQRNPTPVAFAAILTPSASDKNDLKKNVRTIPAGPLSLRSDPSLPKSSGMIRAHFCSFPLNVQQPSHLPPPFPFSIYFLGARCLPGRAKGSFLREPCPTRLPLYQIELPRLRSCLSRPSSRFRESSRDLDIRLAGFLIRKFGGMHPDPRSQCFPIDSSCSPRSSTAALSHSFEVELKLTELLLPSPSSSCLFPHELRTSAVNASTGNERS